MENRPLRDDHHGTVTLFCFVLNVIVWLISQNFQSRYVTEDIVFSDARTGGGKLTERGSHSELQRVSARYGASPLVHLLLAQTIPPAAQATKYGHHCIAKNVFTK